MDQTLLFSTLTIGIGLT